MTFDKRLLKIEPFAVGYLEADGFDDVDYKIGSGLLSQAKHGRLMLAPSAFFAGGYDFTDAGVKSHYAHTIWINDGVLDDEIARYPELATELSYIKERMSPLDSRKLVRQHKSPLEDKLTKMRACWGGDWGGHGNPDYDAFLKLGTSAIIAKINRYRKVHPEREPFYLGLIRSMQALEALAERYASLADELAESAEGDERVQLLRISKALSHSPKNPPRDFFEACQSFWLCFMLMGSDSPGRFDQFMIDYYRASDPKDAECCLRHLWQEFKSTRTWNLCIGGSDENRRDESNELSYLILRLAREYRYNTPNLTMRVHRGTPEALLDEAIETFSSGIGMPVLYNDECVCPALEALGIPPSDARDYCMNGCNQIDIMGKSHMGLEDGEVSLLKALELTLFDGVCQYSQERLAPSLGELERTGSFSEFMMLYKRRVEYLTDAAVKMANDAQAIYAEFAPNPLRSCLISGCIEKGLDYKSGGPLYNHGQILAEGIADTADALAAIKHFVYETKKYTMSELLRALRADFDGYGELYKDFSGYRKFGNNAPYVDELCAEITRHFFTYLRTKRTYRGGIYTGGCSPFNRAALYGERVKAMPNGKRACDTMLADGIGAVPGEDTSGITALLHSALTLPHGLAGSGFILNLKLSRDLLERERGRAAIEACIKVYFEQGGQQISPSVISQSELEDALVFPERHRNLIVRVGGYSDYFINLSKELRENVVRRTLINL